MIKRLIQAIGIGCASALVSLVLWRTGSLARFESVTWDWRARWYAAPARTTDQIRLIFLDQYSLDWGKKKGWSWPWPRQVYAPVLDFCKRAGAKAVAFDVIFSEPSVYGVDDDVALGAAIAGTPGFVGAMFVGSQTGEDTRWPPLIQTSTVTMAPDTSAAGSWVFPRASFPVPEVATNATVLASVFGGIGGDVVYDRLKPFNVFDRQVIPSLGLGAYLAARSNRVVSVHPFEFRVGSTRLPLDANGQLILHYRGRSQTHRTVNVAAVIESELRLRAHQAPIIPLEFFKDSYVFFGFTAPGLKDLRASPVDPNYPGVEVHATLLDNLLAADSMRDAPSGGVVVLCLLLAVAAATAVRLGRSAAHNMTAFAIFLAVPVFLGFYAYTKNVWLPIVPSWLAVAPALVGALAVNYATEGRQKRFIKGAFKQYLSPVVIEELVQHPERLQLGGETRELSILFSDVRGFTSISEGLAPDRLTALLNEYLTAMTEIVYQHGGTVDKYEGDAIIAFWNAPMELPGHAQHAVQAALECQQELTRLRPDLKARYGHDLFARIGINSGPVVVGNMGSRQRFNYTFLGDAGNLASRLEGINKQFGTAILISEMTKTQVGDSAPVREIARVRVVGRQEPVRVYEPLTDDDEAERRSTLAAFAEGLTAYYAGRLEAAQKAFDGIEAADAPAAAYARRCREFGARPPPGDWDGVWVMTEK